MFFRFPNSARNCGGETTSCDSVMKEKKLFVLGTEALSLQSWQQNSWLGPNTRRPEEILNLLGIRDRDLSACHVTGLPSTGLSSPTNAALQAATAALAAAGYRASRENHHYA